MDDADLYNQIVGWLAGFLRQSNASEWRGRPSRAQQIPGRPALHRSE
jgi:hypothetical protein